MADDVFDLDEAFKFIDEHGRKSAKIAKKPSRKPTLEIYLDALAQQESKFHEALKGNKKPTKFDKNTSWVQWSEDAQVYSVRASTPAFEIRNGLLYVTAETPDKVLYLFEIFRRLATSGNETFMRGVLRKYGTKEEKDSVRFVGTSEGIIQRRRRRTAEEIAAAKQAEAERPKRKYTRRAKPE